MKITISDVAKMAGVSKTTVSRITNGKFEYVTEETKARVLEIIKQLDYKPNALAQSLKQMKTNVVGILLSDLQNPFWAAVLEGVEDTCRSHGYNLMICNSNEDSQIEADHIGVLRSKQVDGIIVNPTMKNKSLYESLVNKNYPIVAINRKVEGVPIETVAVDNVKGSMLAIEHLLSLGKRKIAIIIYQPDSISPRLERIEGYKKALIKNDIKVNDDFIHIVEDKKGSTKERVKEILLGPNRPDAIFSTNNMMTLEILAEIKALDLKVPDDIALVGYDETVWSQHLTPPLTTVKQPTYQMGEIAAKNLIDLIDAKGSSQPKTTLLEPSLIVRRSCGSKI